MAELQIDKLRLLQDAIRLRAADMDMRFWHGRENLATDKYHPCKTSHCIAGLCDILFVPNWQELPPWRAGERAAEILGLDYVCFDTDCEAGKLFYTSQWPREDQENIRDAYWDGAPKRIADAICKRIDHLINAYQSGVQEESGEHDPDGILDDQEDL